MDIVLIIIAAIILFAVAVGMKSDYDKAKSDKKKMADFKSNMNAVLIVSLVMLGLLGACVGCLYSDNSSGSGDYHNKDGERQIQYQGSREQQNDLNDIDNYSRDHPGF